MSVSLTDPAQWSNLCGEYAKDTTVGYPDCITGVVSNVSPATGFANAMKNVKQLGLSFGSSGSYASGVAINATAGIFTVTQFSLN